jgi:phosphoenolpyruvate-protein phosphotransferase (PTS system enzyme I)
MEVSMLGVCGDMASHPDSALALLALGVDEVSASVTAIPELKACFAGVNRSELETLAARLKSAADADEARAAAQQLVPEDIAPWKVK